MELLLAVAVLVLFFTLCVVKLRRRDDGPRLPPGPLLPTFVRGNYVDAIAFRKLQQRYGDVVSFKMLGDTYVFLNSHEAIREAFVNQAEVFTGRPSNAILNCTQEGYGLIFTEGDR